VTLNRSIMLACRVGEDVAGLFRAVSQRRLMKQSELLREYIHEGVAADVKRLTSEEPK
jgi:hypothetical protein